MYKNEKIKIGLAVIATIAAATCHVIELNSILVFVVAAISLSLLAMVVGKATEQLGTRMGPGATGILQSALGNLPELFISIFALQAGLNKVVQAALIGSILGNSILVFGVALFVGGLKNGRQQFKSEVPKMGATLMILSLAALAIPTLTSWLHTSAQAHLNSMDIYVAIVLLILFVGSTYYSISEGKKESAAAIKKSNSRWPLALTLTVLIIAGIAAGFVSDWFVTALKPTMASLGINDTFAGLVVVAIAGNAVENFVGVQLAYNDKPDYAVSVILNSSLQIALGLFPILVLLSFVLGGAILSFVLSPMLLACVALGVIVNTFVVFDGESIWLEGLALIGLYCLIASAFWWG